MGPQTFEGHQDFVRISDEVAFAVDLEGDSEEASIDFRPAVEGAFNLDRSTDLRVALDQISREGQKNE